MDRDQKYNRILTGIEITIRDWNFGMWDQNSQDYNKDWNLNWDFIEF